MWQVDFFLNEPMKCKRTQAFQGFNPKSIILMNTGLKITTFSFLQVKMFMVVAKLQQAHRLVNERPDFFF